MSSNRAIPELSIDTQTLERLLAGVVVGQMIGYPELSAAIGRNVQNGASHLLTSARHRLQREQSMMFSPVRGKGLKRLDDRAIVGSAAAAFGRVRNLARREGRKLGCVQDFDALPNDLKIKHNVAVSIFGVLSQVTKDNSLKKLEGKVSEHNALPVAKFLDAVRETL